MGWFQINYWLFENYSRTFVMGWFLINYLSFENYSRTFVMGWFLINYLSFENYSRTFVMGWFQINYLSFEKKTILGLSSLLLVRWFYRSTKWFENICWRIWKNVRLISSRKKENTQDLQKRWLTHLCSFSLLTYFIIEKLKRHLLLESFDCWIAFLNFNLYNKMYPQKQIWV